MISPAPMSREEWEMRLADFADKAIRFIKLSSAPQTQGSAKAAKELRDETISSSNTILDSIMALQAEVERLRAGIKSVCVSFEKDEPTTTMAVATACADLIGHDFPWDIPGFRSEKARQPNV